tara:strand:+ start:5789 stop:6466 length:678 start_codon:yes stop_codon:yes gene_type:complete
MDKNKGGKVLCVGYRDWALDIYRLLLKDNELKGLEFIIIKSESLINISFIDSIKPQLILFYGWSNIIQSDIIENYKCLMLHPSSLPNFRGGSPIQNQIIRGVTESEICIFKMSGEIDKGDILGRKKLDLTGTIPMIFDRMIKQGYALTKFILLQKDPKEYKQIGAGSYYQRRIEAESEITIDEIKTKNAEYIYNKIRMLTGPYPPAYIKCFDGSKVIIKDARLEN